MGETEHNVDGHDAKKSHHSSSKSKYRDKSDENSHSKHKDGAGSKSHKSRSKSPKSSSSKSKKRSRENSRDRRSSKSKKRSRDNSRDRRSSKSSNTSHSKSESSRSASKGREICDRNDDSDGGNIRRRERSRHSVSPSVVDDRPESQIIHDLREQLSQLQQKNSAQDHCFSFDEGDGLDDAQFNSSFSERNDNIIENIESEQMEFDDDAMMSILNKGTDEAKKGKPLNKEGLHIVTDFFDKEPNTELIKEIKERYLEPENCTNLSGKSVNAEIYREINQYARTRDHGLRNIQCAVATAAVANLRLVDELSDLFKRRKIDTEIAKSLMNHVSDSTKVLSKGYSDISVFRKCLMKPHVTYKYQQLCSKRTYGNSLFGDDLGKEIKEIDEQSKIMKRFNKSNPAYGSQQYRYKPYSDHRFSDYRPPKNGMRGRGTYRPSYSQFRGRRPFRSRGKPVTQSQSQTATQQ